MPKTQKKTKSKKKKNHFLFNFFLLILFLAILIIETNIFYASKISTTKKADVIIVLGEKVNDVSPSPLLQTRIDKAYELYKNGYANHIIAVGSASNGENISKAECIYNALIAKGISSENIFLDKISSNTYENLKYTDNIMKRHGFESGIIVTNYYHIFRTLSFGKILSMDISPANAPMPNDTKTFIITNLLETFEILKYYILSSLNLYTN